MTAGIRRIRQAAGAPAPVGPYSQAVVAGSIVYTAGQVPVGPDGSTPPDFTAQVRRTLDNLVAALREAGSGPEHIVKVNTFLTDLAQLQPYNEVYAEYFGDHLAARTSVCVQLWGVSLEIECVAVVATQPQARPADIDDMLWRDLEGIDVPTLGHVLEDGFVDPAVRRLVGTGQIVGRAATVRVGDADAYATNRALAALRPGELLLIDMDGDDRHACVDAVTATAARAAGCAGIVVDGRVTDIADLREIGVPVWGRGTAALTTKREVSGASDLGCEVTIGGVAVRPGELVLADDNGILVIDEQTLRPLLATARETIAAEPMVRQRLLAGEPIRDVLAQRPD